MTLWMCLNVYQEEQLLPECLESIRKAQPEAKIVVVDGAYHSWVQEVKKLMAHHYEYGEDVLAESMARFTHSASTDRTLEIARDFKVDRIIEANAEPWEHEYVKRSQYFVGQTGDWYFVIDGDERIVGRLEIDRLKEEAYNIDLQRDDQDTPYAILRIFKHQEGMHYHGAHHALWVGERVFRKEMFTKIEGVSLRHRAVHRNERDPIRMLAKGAYYRFLTEKEEGAFRSQQGF